MRTTPHIIDIDPGNPRSVWDATAHFDRFNVNLEVRRTLVAYQMDPLDDLIVADATGGAITVTLPWVQEAQPKLYFVKRQNAGVNAVNVAGRGGQLLDGATPVVLALQYAVLTVIPDAALGQWWIV